MTRIRELDSFIDTALNLLAAYPSTTTLSITYTNVEKKRKDKVSKPRSANAVTHSISVKLFEPRSGKIVKFRTSKTKELLKILFFIGPKGINITKEEESVHNVGLALIMSNTEHVEAEEVAEVVEAVVGKKSKKKKKRT